MKQGIVFAFMAATLCATVAPVSEAARVRVVHTRAHTRVRVTVRPGFPIRRTLPEVVVRPGPVIRVAPRAYLAPVVFGAVVVASLPAQRAWSSTETISRDEGWTDFTMDVDRRGTGLLLEVDKGPAQVSFAEVVFENGESQVVDFNDATQRRGVYSLLDFKDGRKVDHVRIVAAAAAGETEIHVHLV